MRELYEINPTWMLMQQKSPSFSDFVFDSPGKNLVYVKLFCLVVHKALLNLVTCYEFKLNSKLYIFVRKAIFNMVGKNNLFALVRLYLRKFFCQRNMTHLATHLNLHV
jgi:hypothetical protein